MSPETEVIECNTLDFLSQLIALDPFGPVTNSSCALAALHNKTVRVAQGFDQPDNTTANQFFDRAYWQLINAGSRGSSIQGTSASINPPNSGFTEADALAAIQLIGFFLLREGHGDWQTHLETAREWMIQTGLPAEENADTKATFANMNETQKFTVKMVIVSHLSSARDFPGRILYGLALYHSGTIFLQRYAFTRALVSSLCIAVFSETTVTQEITTTDPLHLGPLQASEWTF